jgi:hypothetical protein
MRVVATVGCVILGFLVIRGFWMFVVSSPYPADVFLFVIFDVPLAAVAVLLGWLALRGHNPRTRTAVSFGCVTGLWFAIAAFVILFFGPLILMERGVIPDSGQAGKTRRSNACGDALGTSFSNCNRSCNEMRRTERN